MSNELNIKSSTIEKVLDLAKEFMAKLIGPTIEETGLLISDKVRYFRFKNQIKILEKAKKYIDSRNLKIKEVPVKILAPLMEYASLESEPEMQEKWAHMIGNLADSTQNLENHIFPYLLSQISLEEYQALLRLDIEERGIKESIEKRSDKKDISFEESRELDEEYENFEQQGLWIVLQEFERANLERLGLIRRLTPKIDIGEIKSGLYDYETEWHNVELKYRQDEFGYKITQLGVIFLRICESKKASG